MLSEVTVSLPPFIADISYSPPADMLRELDDAAHAIIALDAGYGDRLGFLGRFLIRTEAVSSSKIEYVEAPIDDYARAMIGIRANSSASSMVAATDALTEMVERAGTDDRITDESILDAHAVLMRDDVHDGPYAGAYREMQNWIGGSDHSPRLAVHVPPPPETVEGYMDDLLRFAHRDDLSPVAQAAIAHAQFESIHPFTDGNGRIGRTLINAIFRRRGLTRSTVTPIASAMVADKAAYFRFVNDYREGSIHPFVRDLAASAVLTSEEAARSARTLEGLPDEWRELTSVRGGAAGTLIDALLDAPVLTSRAAEEIVGGSISSTFAAIDRLVDAGVLHEITNRRRGRVWAATAVLDELEDLAVRIDNAVVDRAGRRAGEG